MALRNILNESDPILRKKCRPVEKFDDRLHQLLDDMIETMNSVNGVGLAAPQVGVLRRVCIVDVGEGPIELINPVVTQTVGAVVDNEGCLSSPGEYALVERPEEVTVEALDRHGNAFEIEGGGLMARALCHETDHLDGKLFKDIMIRLLTAAELEGDEEIEVEI